MHIRTAGASDLDGLTYLLTEAFVADPLWSWAFPEREGLEAWWRFVIGSALRYPCVWIVGDYAAASVWIPPGGVEITDEEEERVEPLLHDLVGTRTVDLLALLEQFDESHPKSEPHYYLSLLGTADRHRGRGLGMALLSENLRRMDEEGVPAYLESSNPANDRRYEQVGFHRTGSFTTPDGKRTIATMWRDAGSDDRGRADVAPPRSCRLGREAVAPSRPGPRSPAGRSRLSEIPPIGGSRGSKPLDCGRPLDPRSKRPELGDDLLADDPNLLSQIG